YSRHMVPFGNNASGNGISTRVKFNYKDIPSVISAKIRLPNGTSQDVRLPLLGISIAPVNDDNSFDKSGFMTYTTANPPERYIRILRYFQQGK
ncbi:MAG: hypothetical protein ACEQSF_04365, partial [Solirubrobacteraceae bacterium]